MQKILITWWNWMLAFDFKKYFWSHFEIFSFGKDELDITKIEEIEKLILEIKPDIILNFAAYTKVDLAEDEGKKENFEVNVLWVYNLAKITNKYNVDFITFSTDYVFSGEKPEWYDENDLCNPINEYWMSKYLGEKLALKENKNSIIIRTSWLYWWWKDFKNFVNTILRFADIKPELKVINDQFWNPTFTKDLCEAIFQTIENISIHRWKISHFSNTSEKWVSWFEFAKEILDLSWKNTKIIPCTSEEYITKAKRPKFSILKDNNNAKSRNWKESLKEYLISLE